MPTLRYSIDIRRPPEAVFDFLDDFANDVSWRSNVVEMVPRGNPSDPLGKWGRHVERRQVPGRIIETETVLTDRDRPRRLAFQRADGAIRPKGAYRLEPRGEGTHLDFELEVRLHGGRTLLAPLIWALLNAVVKPALPGDFARLKQRLETS
jgi:carbon monoxide dehydrogenase subunit G